MKTPIIIEAKPGTYAWCTCGLSKQFPRCDGSHVGGEKAPIIENVTEEKTIAICSCGASDSIYCNGSHKNLK